MCKKKHKIEPSLQKITIYESIDIRTKTTETRNGKQEVNEKTKKLIEIPKNGLTQTKRH